MNIKHVGMMLACWLCMAAGMAQNWSRAIDELMDASAWLRTSEVGLLVYNLSADSLVYTHQADKLYRPASTEKVITAVSALASLEPGFCFTTCLKHTGTVADSVLKGDLYVVGGFDPLFQEKDLEGFVHTLAKSGIRRIEGKLIGDVSLMDSVYWGPGWSWDDSPEAFQPYLSPLMLERGCVSVTVEPAAKGQAARVDVSPASDYYQVVNHSVSRLPEAGKLVVTRDWLVHGNQIQISGCVSARRTKKLNVYDSKAFFLHTFRYQLAQQGVQVGDVAYGICPEEACEIARCERPLDEVLEEALKKSDNLAAEALFYQIGKQVTGKERHLGNQDGRKGINELMKQLVEKDPEQYSIADGSGVSLYNYVSPELLLAYLNYAYRHPAVFQLFYHGLPIAGIDGTLKNRMKKGKAFRNVRAKTGTVTGVSSLAGYVKAANGDWLSFVIINQNVLKGGLARRFQDRVCEILAD